MRSILALGLLILPAPALAQDERAMRELLCAGMAQEVTVASGGRADCVSPTHAIEVDWTENWAAGLGQAMHYASQTGLEPGLILICHQQERTCLGHVLRAEATFAHWRIVATIWRCTLTDTALDQCLATPLSERVPLPTSPPAKPLKQDLHLSVTISEGQPKQPTRPLSALSAH